ncbi:MAG: glycosyl hydrolase family 17 [Cyclobacteriaceae bacterium]
MNCRWKLLAVFVIASVVLNSCKTDKKETIESNQKMTAKDILGNPDYLAISYGGYRDTTRTIQPTVDELKEDLKILSAIGVGILRTYNVQPDKPHAANILKAINELKQEDQAFEMYVMLGAWIDCKNAWTGLPVDHDVESESNTGEIARAAALARQYPDIVKVLAVGNEAMVKWAESYYVQPDIILKWVNHLQGLKQSGDLPKDLWITSSDDFSSWGGGDSIYHVPALEELIKAVDYVSMHTYPMHNTFYNPFFWGISEQEADLSKEEQINLAMNRSVDFAKDQYQKVKAFVESIAPGKPVHIGETGWATVDSENHHYGKNGTRATDEYKEALYYQKMREWTNSEGISCFYFEAFDEKWKDANSPQGSENHFGLITVDGQAKYALWDLFDQGAFNGQTRGGKSLTKTFEGDQEKVLEEAFVPPINSNVKAK